MKLRNHYLVMVLAACFIAASGCSSAARSNRQSVALPVKVLYESDLCTGVDQDPKIMVIKSDEELLRGVLADDRTRIYSDQQLSVPIDFTSNQVVLVSMGQQRTGGFRISLDQAQAVVAGEVARIKLKWTRPSADDMVAQVLTHPCILLSLPEGGYSRIAVFDQHGSKLFETDINAR